MSSTLRKNRTSKYRRWREEARTLFADHENWGGTAVFAELSALEGTPGYEYLGKLPDARTITRWRADFFLAYPKPIQPDSHQNGIVPWNAQRISRYIRRLMANEGRATPVSVIMWAYNLTVAAPEMPWYVEPNPQLPHDKSRFCVYHVARNLAAHETEWGRLSLSYNPSFPIEERVTYAQVVGDLLDRELWRDDTPAHELEMHRQLEMRAPLTLADLAEVLEQNSGTLAALAEELEQRFGGRGE